MNDQPERSFKVINPSIGTGTHSMATAAPVGAVRRRDRERAGKTALHREGPSTLLLDTELPGSVLLQRRGVDGTWETLETRRASRPGRTKIDLPDGATSQTIFRVLFSPKNTNITPWTSENIDG